MSNPLNLDWITFRSATAIGKVQTYIQLPTFTYNHTWQGASEIITQWNFSASKNFVLKNRPTKPSGCNFLLCIRWRTGNTVYRWKLWDGVGENLPGVPVYNGEIIKKNFVLEVWSTNGATVSNATAINIITSVVSVPTNFRSLSATAFATGTEYPKADVDVVITPKTLPNTSELQFRFESDSGLTYDGSNEISQWTDSVNGFNMVYNPSYFKPAYVSSDALVNNKPVVQLAASTPLKASGITTNNIVHMFVVLQQRTWTSASQIFALGYGGSTIFSLKQKNGGSTPEIEGFTGAASIGTLSQVPVGVSAAFRIIEIVLTDLVSAVINVYPITGGAALETISYLLPPAITYNEISIGIAGATTCVDVAALFGYGTMQQSSDVTLVLDYLAEKYGGVEQEFSLPLAFGEGNAWLSND